MKSLNFIFQALGIMPKSQILENCRYLGENISKLVHESKGHLSPEQMKSVFAETINAKYMSKIDLCCTREEFVAQMQKRGFSLKEAESWYDNSAGGVLFGKRPLLNMPVDKNSSINLVDTATHESEHALSSAFSIKEKFLRFIKKIGINFEKYELSHSEIQELEQSLMRRIANFNYSAMGCTRGQKGLAGLLERSNSASESEMLNKIKQEIYHYAKLDETSPRKNLKKLFNLKRHFDEEYMAYKAGGDAVNHWLDNYVTIKFTGQISNSEVTSDLYAEVLKVINSEIKTAFKDRVTHIK